MKPIFPERIRRLLVRGTNWVGDAVMSIPALREIRRLFPNAHISLLVRPWVRDVYAAADFIDEILIYEKPGIHEGWNGMRRLAVELRAGKFDMAILLQNAIEAALIAFWARIPIRVGYRTDGRSLLLTHAVPLDPEIRKVHQAYYYLDLLSGIGMLERQIWKRPGYALHSLQVGVCPEDMEAARQLLLARGINGKRPIVGIHPGASFGSAKRWPAERFAAVADALTRDFSARILLFGAAKEIQFADEVRGRMQTAPEVFAGETTLGQLMGLLRACRLLITNDSGPMHLAAALDVPLLAIFGSTSEIATGPLNAKARVMKHAVDCNPCFLRECPTDFRCMLDLTVEEVLDAARQELRESRG